MDWRQLRALMGRSPKGLFGETQPIDAALAHGA